MCGVLLEECSLVSSIIAISMSSSCISLCISVILFWIPLILICRMERLFVFLNLECIVVDDEDRVSY